VDSSKSLQLLIINDRYLPDNSGTSIRPARLVQALIKLENIEVHVAAFNKTLISNGDVQLPTFEVMDGIHVYRFLTDINMIRGLISLHRKFAFDIIHFRGVRYSVYAKILKILRQCSTIFELNTLPAGGFLRSILLHYALHSADRVILLSEYAKDWAINEIGVEGNNIDIVLNGADLNSFDNEAFCIRDNVVAGINDSIVIGYCGIFSEWQGVFDIVRSAAIVTRDHHNVRFLMVGSGPDLDKTIELTKQLHVYDKFVFTGCVPPENVPGLINCMDIFLIVRPTDYLKNQLAVPLKLIEAMAMGKAIVVTPVHGLSEVIGNRETGLISGRSIDSIATAVNELIEDSALRSRLGQAARCKVETNYTWEHMAKKLMICYRRAMKML